jgi:hypothetical protein
VTNKTIDAVQRVVDAFHEVRLERRGWLASVNVPASCDPAWRLLVEGGGMGGPSKALAHLLEQVEALAEERGYVPPDTRRPCTREGCGQPATGGLCAAHYADGVP